MCWSKATLFLGLWVTTASLNFAATAHKATRPTIVAIDLIINRCRRGKLEIEGQEEKTTARELPEEVWELVKDELLGVGVKKADFDTLDDLRCEDCQLGGVSCGCPVCERARDLGPRWTTWGPPDCITGDCVENSVNSAYLFTRSEEQIEVGWLHRRIPGQFADVNPLQNIRGLLQHHGLEIPFEDMWHENPDT